LLSQRSRVAGQRHAAVHPVGDPRRGGVRIGQDRAQIAELARADIDRGKISYDGSIEGLVRAARPEKRVSLRLGAPVPSGEVDALGGEIISRADGVLIMQVKPGEMNRLITTALARLPVVDFTVEDPPLEEVLTDFFSRSRQANERGDDAVEEGG
jgi:ABC-type uncharacterized transport system ATPase subunit